MLRSLLNVTLRIHLCTIHVYSVTVWNCTFGLARSFQGVKLRCHEWGLNSQFCPYSITLFGLIITTLTFCSRRGEGRWEELAGEARRWPWWQLCQSLPNLLLRLSLFIRRKNGCEYMSVNSKEIDRSKDPLLISECPFGASLYWAFSFRTKMIEKQHQADIFFKWKPN